MSRKGMSTTAIIVIVAVIVLVIGVVYYNSMSPADTAVEPAVEEVPADAAETMPAVAPATTE